MTQSEEKRVQRMEIAEWAKVVVLIIGLGTIIYKVGQRDQELTQLKLIVVAQQQIREEDVKEVHELDKRVQRNTTLLGLQKPQS